MDEVSCMRMPSKSPGIASGGSGTDHLLFLGNKGHRVFPHSRDNHHSDIAGFTFCLPPIFSNVRGIVLCRESLESLWFVLDETRSLSWPPCRHPENGVWLLDSSVLRDSSSTQDITPRVHPQSLLLCQHLFERIGRCPKDCCGRIRTFILLPAFSCQYLNVGIVGFLWFERVHRVHFIRSHHGVEVIKR
ncbi:hypothetical protein BD769DRAFT_138545 [Suillus cothurnatus]|nr:hypothetical protein BD769DRAFT_138545 [Suillus cothurnatus]